MGLKLDRSMPDKQEALGLERLTVKDYRPYR